MSRAVARSGFSLAFVSAKEGLHNAFCSSENQDKHTHTSRMVQWWIDMVTKLEFINKKSVCLDCLVPKGWHAGETTAAEDVQ